MCYMCLLFRYYILLFNTILKKALEKYFTVKNICTCIVKRHFYERLTYLSMSA